MLHRTHLVIMLAFAGAYEALSLAVWHRMPERVAIHWNLDGEADSWGPAWTLAVGFPLLCLALTAVLCVLPRIGPFRENLAGSSIAYGRICVVVVGGVSVIGAVAALKNAGFAIDLSRTCSIVFGLMFVAMGNWMSKVQRNFWMGIRTPWTLANETVWYRTHRVGGRMMMLSGVASVVAGLVSGGAVCFFVLMGGLGLTALWSLVYSCVEYRRLGGADDLHPAAPAGPLPAKDHRP